jgi:hypothetical protein
MLAIAARLEYFLLHNSRLSVIVGCLELLPYMFSSRHDVEALAHAWGFLLVVEQSLASQLRKIPRRCRFRSR